MEEADVVFTGHKIVFDGSEVSPGTIVVRHGKIVSVTRDYWDIPSADNAKEQQVCNFTRL